MLSHKQSHIMPLIAGFLCFTPLSIAMTKFPSIHQKSTPNLKTATTIKMPLSIDFSELDKDLGFKDGELVNTIIINPDTKEPVTRKGNVTTKYLCLTMLDDDFNIINPAYTRIEKRSSIPKFIKKDTSGGRSRYLIGKTHSLLEHFKSIPTLKPTIADIAIMPVHGLARYRAYKIIDVIFVNTGIKKYGTNGIVCVERKNVKKL